MAINCTGYPAFKPNFDYTVNITPSNTSCFYTTANGCEVVYNNSVYSTWWASPQSTPVASWTNQGACAASSSSSISSSSSASVSSSSLSTQVDYSQLNTSILSLKTSVDSLTIAAQGAEYNMIGFGSEALGFILGALMMYLIHRAI